MATPVWQPGTLYPNGSIVRPVSTPPSNVSALDNPNFESGDTGWTKPAGWQILNQAGYDGNWVAEYSGGGIASIANDARAPITPGTSVTASAMVAPRHANNGARVIINWYNAANASIGFSAGNLITGDIGFARSTASGLAPANTAFASVDISASRGAGPTIYADQASWNLQNTGPPAGLVYKAVQPLVGSSGATEPAWPPTVGVQVIDNTVIWEAVQDSRVVWEASPIMQSGPTEPVWPLVIGSFISDGTVSWQTVSRRVEDENCPNTRAVTIASSKVYAVDEDIIRFSATVNPLDWTTPDDAGYLPSGLNQNGSNDTEVLNLYRSNVVSFSSSTFQNWQVDPDPANMSLLDSIEGIGSIYQLAAQPVANDLFYLASLGVRTVGIAAGSTNLAAGDIGMPIDPLIQAEMLKLAMEGWIPRGLYYPSQGQYLIFFGPQGFVCSMNQIGQPGKWTRYVYPWEIEGTALLNDDLYFRSDDTIYLSDTNRLDDEDADAEPVPVTGLIRWPYLDFGAPGQTKMMLGFDVVGRGVCSVQFGYDQNDFDVLTPAYEIQADTLTGGIIPMPLSAPSFSMQLTFSSDDNTDWEWLASNMYLADNRMTS